MLYTRKGDNGTTKTLSTKEGERISKDSTQTEALGTLDELNSYLGVVKVKARHARFLIDKQTFESLINQIQQNLFIVQAELAGADKKIAEEKIIDIEHIIDTAETMMPPIKSFFISGGTDLAANFDFARTLSRRAERRVIEHNNSSEKKLNEHTLSYLNRLSSLLYALARLANYKSGITEQPPNYS